MRCTPLPVLLAVSLLLPTPASGEEDLAGTTKALQRTVAAWRATELDVGAFRAYALWQTCARTPAWRAAARRLALSRGPNQNLYRRLAQAPTRSPFGRPNALLPNKPATERSLEEAGGYLAFLSHLDALWAKEPATATTLLRKHAGHPWIEPQLALLAHEAVLKPLLAESARLDLPSVKDLQRVEVVTLRGAFKDGVIWRPRGWLLDRNARSFHVFHDDLDARIYTREPVPTPTRLRLKRDLRAEPTLPCWRPLDFQGEVYRLLGAGPPDEFAFLLAYRNGSLHTPSQAILLARWALERARRGLALRLMVRATELHARYQNRNTPLGHAIAADYAQNRWLRGVKRFGEGAPREELKARFREVLKRFPGSEYAERAKALLVGIEPQLAAERSYRVPNWKAWQRLSTEEKLRHLVFNLKDLDGQQLSQPGSCSVFSASQRFPPGAPPRPRPGQFFGPGTSVADRFIDLGWLSIPTLIELIDDRRPTRSLGYWRTFAPDSFLVLTYGDAAVQILERICGERFSASSEYVSVDGAGSVKAAALGWWKKHGQESEFETRASRLRELGVDAVSQTFPIFGIDPVRAQALILEILPNARGTTRTGFLVALGRFGDEKALAHLEREVATSAPLVDRVAVATELAERGRSAWRAPLAEELEQIATKSKPAARASSSPLLITRGSPEEQLDVTRRLFLLLVTRGGSKEQLDARRLLPRLGLWLPDLVGNLCRQSSQPGARAVLADILTNPLPGRLSPHQSEELLTRVAGSLAAALDLPQPGFNAPQYLSRGAAACWRVEVLNRWRKGEGQAALPLPKPPSIPIAPPQLLAKAHAELLRIPTQGLASFHALGLSGLAPLQSAVAALPADHPGIPASEPVLAALASTTRHVEVHGVENLAAPRRAEVEHAWRVQVGRPASAGLLVALIRAELRSRPVGRATLTLSRGADGTGVELRLHLGPSSNLGHVSFDCEASLGTHGIMSARGTYSSAKRLAASDAQWSQIKSCLERILGAPPHVRGELEIRLDW